MPRPREGPRKGSRQETTPVAARRALPETETKPKPAVRGAPPTHKVQGLIPTPSPLVPITERVRRPLVARPGSPALP